MIQKFHCENLQVAKNCYSWFLYTSCGVACVYNAILYSFINNKMNKNNKTSICCVMCIGNNDLRKTNLLKILLDISSWSYK